MLELQMQKTQFTYIRNTGISRGSPKLRATSTKHRHQLSYYKDHGDYNRLASSHSVSLSLYLYGLTCIYIHLQERDY
jgi:hypothetical protein